jgi:Tfp pilus assembly protein PilN
VRVLGILIVVLSLAAAVLITVMRRVISPALRRRRIAQLERENERLDRLIRGHGDTTDEEGRT